MSGSESAPAQRSDTLPFGVSRRDGRLYEPRQVPIGKDCNCVCPACGGALYAKHCLAGGRTPHFAHAPGADCAAGGETSIHLAAKQLLLDHRVLFFPPLAASVQVVDALLAVQRRSRRIAGGGRQALENVQAEQSLGPIRPDVLAEAGELGTVAIEIAVTHFIDAGKRAQFEELAMPVLEVDLSGLRDITFDRLYQILVESGERTTWVYNPAQAAAEEALRASLQGQLDAAQTRAMARAEAGRHESERYLARLDSERRRAEAARELGRRRQEERRLRTERFKAAGEQEKRAMLLGWLGSSELPPSLHLPTRLRGAFGMQDAAIWQTTLFMGLVHDRAANGVAMLTVDFAMRWLEERYATTIAAPDNELALRDYLHGLTRRGALYARQTGHFTPGVAHRTAFEALLYLRSAQRVPVDAVAAGLAWTDERRWPSERQSTTIAMVMNRTPALPDNWRRLCDLSLGIRDAPSYRVCEWGQALGIPPATALEFAVRAGFLRVA